MGLKESRMSLLEEKMGLLERKMWIADRRNKTVADVLHCVYMAECKSRVMCS